MDKFLCVFMMKIFFSNFALIILSTMSVADYIIIGILAIACVTGAISGAIKQIGAFAGFILALIVTRLCGPSVVSWIVPQNSAHAYIYSAVIYVLLFVVVFVVVFFVARLMRGTAKKVGLGPFDRIAGAIVRTLVWAVVLSACLNLYFAVCPQDKGPYCANKPWRGVLVRLAPSLVGFMSDRTT